MGKTLSFGKGKGNIKHNNREYLTPNVDKYRTQDNVYLVRQDIKDAYKECFGQAIENYNATQKRSDRKKSISAYMDEIKRNQANRNGEKLFYEQIVCIGDMHDSGIITRPEDAQTCKTILLDYFKKWQERNPNLYVFNAVLHMDEATPHLHIDYIPVGYGYKQGLQARNSLTKAFECMGIDSAKSKEDNATKKWQTREREYIAKIAKEYGIDIDVLGIKRRNYTIDEYKVLVRDKKQSLKQLSDKAEKPKRIVLPFGMALETNRKNVDTVLQLKAGIEDIEKHYEQATKTAENAIEQATDGLKVIKGIEQEKMKALADLQSEKEKYMLEYQKQRDLNETYNLLSVAYQNQNKDIKTLKSENTDLKRQRKEYLEKIDTQDIRLTELRTENAELTQKSSNYGQLIELSETQKQTISDLESKIITLTEELTKQKKQSEKLIEAVKEKGLKLQNFCKSQGEIIKTLRTENAELTQKSSNYGQLIELSEIQKQTISDLESEITVLRKEYPNKAQKYAADLLILETDREKMSDLYESAARKGDEYAQNNLGINYLTGDGVKKNSKRAVILFEKAAEQGNGLAMVNLAYCYATGEGARKNPKRAFELYLQAAEKGVILAYKPVADCFFFGKGTEQDLDQAFKFYMLATYNGDISARKMYVDIKENYKQEKLQKPIVEKIEVEKKSINRGVER